MSKLKIYKSLNSFIMIPMLLASPLSGLGVMKIDLLDKNENIAIENSVITTQEEVERSEKAEAIDAYFKRHNAPLSGHGLKFVIEAEKNGIDWRLLPAIAMRESTGGKHACKSVPNSVFGWGSCKMGFDSIDKSIEHIAKTISGNNPNVKAYKVGMTSEQILKKYNPDSIIPGYSLQVIKIMNSIKKETA